MVSLKSSSVVKTRPRQPWSPDACMIKVHDIRTIYRCVMTVQDFRFDDSIMVHPEYAIATEIIFACRQFPHEAFISSWITWRTFEEFRVLDHQLRQVPTPPVKALSDSTEPVPRYSWWGRPAADSSAHPMDTIEAPRLHRRRKWLFQHKTKAFMLRRQGELDSYLISVCATPLRLLHFLDVRAPPYLRYFCNFDVAFGAHVARTVWNPSLGVVEHDKLDMLEANLADDARRGIIVCSTYGCQCQFLSLGESEARMAAALAVKQLEVVPWGVAEDHVLAQTAYMCIVQELYSMEDMELELESMGLLSDKPTIVTSSPAVAAADKVRRYMANYGLLHAEAIADLVGLHVVDVKKSFHVCKKAKQVRVGALALQTLATMLNVTITLVTNDHRHTVRHVMPWESLPSLVTGPPRHLVWNYLLPTAQYIHGHYRLLRSIAAPAATLPLMRQDWLAVDEAFVHRMTQVIEANEITVMDSDGTTAEELQQGILDAVWHACDQNPKRFQSFQWTSKQYGTSRMPGAVFFAFLEKLFRPTGAAYITDFLVHVLPLPNKRQSLLRARWSRFHSELMVTRASILHLTSRRSLTLSRSSSFVDSSTASTLSTSPTEI
ncbi:unnamed protein product [Aphanomyces euteiches]|uniref:PX domain-containing protein n=1 Tax=Aphanomyces euteiches TaxID=100861 RepID=A0A6G0X1F8_9STRA|nr:hypothetical protein Ae201684_009490 [Aphanomyces euteiches]KAH9085303.1 hypothetical protein Ae201684P_005013 [Aphanomyces euteiches]